LNDIFRDLFHCASQFSSLTQQIANDADRRPPPGAMQMKRSQTLATIFSISYNDPKLGSDRAVARAHIQSVLSEVQR